MYDKKYDFQCMIYIVSIYIVFLQYILFNLQYLISCNVIEIIFSEQLNKENIIKCRV